MNNYFRKQIKKGYECDLLESALTVVIGNEIIKPELEESTIIPEVHYNLMYKRKDKNKCSYGFAVSLNFLRAR